MFLKYSKHIILHKIHVGFCYMVFIKLRDFYFIHGLWEFENIKKYWTSDNTFFASVKRLACNLFINIYFSEITCVRLWLYVLLEHLLESTHKITWTQRRVDNELQHCFLYCLSFFNKVFLESNLFSLEQNFLI